MEPGREGSLVMLLSAAGCQSSSLNGIRLRACMTQQRKAFFLWTLRKLNHASMKDHQVLALCVSKKKSTGPVYRLHFANIMFGSVTLDGSNMTVQL